MYMHTGIKLKSPGKLSSYYLIFLNLDWAIWMLFIDHYLFISAWKILIFIKKYLYMKIKINLKFTTICHVSQQKSR